MGKLQLFPVISAVLICSAAPYQRMTFRDQQGKVSATAVKFGEQVIYRDADGKIGGRVTRFGNTVTFRDADGKPAATVSGDGQKVIIKDAAGTVTGIKPLVPEKQNNRKK